MRYVLLDPAHQSMLEATEKARPGFLKRVRTVLGALAAVCLAVVFFLSFFNPLQVMLDTGYTTGETFDRHVGRYNRLSVDYRYTVDGVMYRGFADASQDMYDAVPSTNLTVLYARHNPGNSLLGPMSPQGLACLGAQAIGLGLCFIAAAFSAIRERFKRPSHRIMRGTLREISLTKAQSGTLWRLEYDFLSPRRKTIVGHYTLLPPPHQTPPSVGTALAILYQDDQVHHPL